MAQEEKSPFEGVDESTSFLDLLRRAIKSSPAAEVGAEATGIPSIARVASGDSSTMDKADAALTAMDFLLPMIPIGALFHGTSSMRLPSIMKAGIVPRSTPGPEMAFTSRPSPARGVFTSPYMDVAANFATDRAFEDAYAVAKKLLKSAGIELNTVDAQRAIDQLDEVIKPVILKIDEGERAADIPARFGAEEVFSRGFSPQEITDVRMLPHFGAQSTVDVPADLFQKLRDIVSAWKQQ